jgi:hypothetical protein
MGGVAVRAVGCKATWEHDLSAVDGQESKPWLATKFCRGGRVVGVGEGHIPGYSRELCIRRDQERSGEVLCCRDWEYLAVADDVVRGIIRTVSWEVELNAGLCRSVRAVRSQGRRSVRLVQVVKGGLSWSSAKSFVVEGRCQVNRYRL